MNRWFLTRFVIAVVILLVIGTEIVSAVPTPTIYVSYLNGTMFNSTVNATKGQVLYFNATQAGGAPPITWAWAFGDGFTDSSQNVTHFYAWGKDRVLLLHNGWAQMTTTLKASDATGSGSATVVINLTTSLANLTMATANVSMLNESYAQSFLAAIGGNRSAPFDWHIDWLGALHTAEHEYADIVGWTVFLTIIFALPFIMNWIITKDFVVSGILGGFLGIYIIVRLPAALRVLAVVFIGMSITAIVYSLYKERQ